MVLAPRCARHYNDGEAAAHGEAAMALNVREQEQSLVVTGQPVQRGTIPTGHRLMLVDNGHFFTVAAGVVYCDGTAVTQSATDVLAMHRVGSGIVVVNATGLIHLRYSGNTVVETAVSEAVPQLQLTMADQFTSQQQLAAVTFAEPYTTWAAPLSAADEKTIASNFAMAWKTASTAITSVGAYFTPLMACYGVRLHDDNYLWISNPTTIGLTTMANAQQVAANCVTASSRYTGIVAATLAMSAYRVGIKVTSGVGEHWLPLVKAIDVFVTTQPTIASQSLSYRCAATHGTSRVPALLYGWQAQSQEQVLAQLAASGWSMVATTTDLASLADGRFVASNVVRVAATATDVVSAPMVGGATLTREQVEAIARGSSEVAPVASLVRNGRLYTASADGHLAMTAQGNALATAQVTHVTGAQVLALAPVLRPLYSGGFGRYAVYMFTNEGIYAVAQSAQGRLGEARLVDRAVIAPGCVPVDGDRDVYFVNRYNSLCRLTGSAVEVLLPGIGEVQALAWDDCHGELHVLADGGETLAVQASGHYSRRTVEASQLYNDTSHALAVTAQGEVLDLTHENDAQQQVLYQSHPIVLAGQCAVPRSVSWCVISNAAQVALSLHGERGMSCHGFLIGRLRVNGVVRAPLAVPVVSSPCRSVRFTVDGTALSGTVIATLKIRF